MSQAARNSVSPRAAVSAACRPPSGPQPGTQSATLRYGAGAAPPPTITTSPVSGVSTASWRSRIVRPSTISALLSRPPKRVARPPARMAALFITRSYSDMREAGIGRVLVASLHQGIADILPTRLDFYENWLNADGLREGTIGLAPLYAVLSFLRQEGEAYQMITTRAGEYAAEWTVQSLPPARRAIIKGAPPWLRGRLILRIAGDLVRSSFRGNRALTRLRKGTASIEVRASIFCTVREPAPQPLCGFYAAAL